MGETRAWVRPMSSGNIHIHELAEEPADDGPTSDEIKVTLIAAHDIRPGDLLRVFAKADGFPQWWPLVRRVEHGSGKDTATFVNLDGLDDGFHIRTPRQVYVVLGDWSERTHLSPRTFTHTKEGAKEDADVQEAPQAYTHAGADAAASWPEPLPHKHVPSIPGLPGSDCETCGQGFLARIHMKRG